MAEADAHHRKKDGLLSANRRNVECDARIAQLLPDSTTHREFGIHAQLSLHRDLSGLDDRAPLGDIRFQVVAEVRRLGPRRREALRRQLVLCVWLADYHGAWQLPACFSQGE
jgi:hypothetical protein